MSITKEELRNYRKLRVEIAALEAEIRAMYSPVGSPPTEIIGSRGNTPGDPTAQTVYRIEGKREKLEAKIAEYLELTERIEQFVEEIDDLTVKSIVRLHFLVGYSWRQTCVRVYGYADPDTCRNTFNRYMSRIGE